MKNLSTFLELKLSREEEARLFNAAEVVLVFCSTVEDYEYGELQAQDAAGIGAGYKYFYSYSKNRTSYTDEKVFRFTNDSTEYNAALSKTLEEFGTGDSGIDEFVTHF